MSKKGAKAQTPSTMKQLKEVAGLFTCLMEHRVVATEAQFKWDGPMIPQEEWDKVLAFFRWTYDESKSESQVRLYVNPVEKTWRAWAYPQEAKTGMSARELPDEEKFKEQRAQFAPPWIYFGTVHHHCLIAAFQSSVDESNEKDQSGLHITVGNMDDKRYTIHDRFYISGQLIDHDLSWFFDIGDAMEDVPDWCKALLPADIKDRLARGHMGVPPPKDTEFPQEWKDNLIFVKPPVSLPVHYQGGLGYQGSERSWTFQRVPTNASFDLRTARQQFTKLCQEKKMDEMDALSEMYAIMAEHDKFTEELISLMYRNDVTLPKLAEFIKDDLVGEKTNVHQKVTDMIAEGGSQHNGVPDYEGTKTPSDFGDPWPNHM